MDTVRRSIRIPGSGDLRALFAGLAIAWVAAGAVRADEAAVEFFEKRVRPILVNRCYECHGPTKQKSSLRWDHISFVQQGGETGPVVVAGDPSASRMIHAIHYDDVELQMPPKGRLPKSEIQTLEQWVAMGLPWPDEPAPRRTVKKGFDLEARKTEHWAWRPITPTAPPSVRDAGWAAHPIDRFIQAKREAEGLPHAPAANKRTLIRRVYFDVIGLPPTPNEVQAFLDDRSPDAYEKVVDRLLASPRYGERWGRHWMDLMRYAESRGHEGDDDAPNAYQYRDYVIRAFNQDVPYDRFVAEHLAGDLMTEPRLHPTEGYNESVLGTGFWFLGEWMHSPVDIRQDELDRYDNMIDVASKAFLGLTVACARCHDHKFDAITAADYYSMAGYLQSTNYRQVRFETMEHNRAVAESLNAQRARAQPHFSNLVGKVTAPVVERLDDYLLGAQRVLLSAPHAVRSKPEPVVAEAEDLAVLGVSAGELSSDALDGKTKGFTGGRYLQWEGGVEGDTLTIQLPVAQAGRYRLVMNFARTNMYGDIRVGLDDQALGRRVSLYEAKNNRYLPTGPIDFGAVDLVPGAHRLSITVVGKTNPKNGAYGVGVDTIRLDPVEGDPDAAPYGMPRYLADNANFIQLVALEDDLSLNVLTRWVEHLVDAADDPSDPFHAFALVSFEENEAWDQHIRSLVEGWQERDSAAATALDGVRVLEDYTVPQTKPWLADGFAFGSGPVASGAIRIGSDPASPIAEITHLPGVYRDPDWKGLGYAPGRQTGTSSLDKFLRSGQTFRTATFDVQGDNLWYLVRGAGYAYVNVDSHHMIRGPLHAQLVNSWRDDASGAPRWVKHGGLKAYIGHNAHVEFSPLGDEDMAVLMVVESDQQPALPIGANGLLLKALTRPAALSPAKLALAYRFAFYRVHLRFGSGAVASRDEAEWRDWLVRHLDLFAPRGGAHRELLATAAQAEVDNHRRLVQTIRRKSLTAMAIQEGSGIDEHVLLRGSKHSLGDPAPRRLLEAIGGADQAPPAVGSGRMQWVSRMLDDANPFPARVMVNRIWHHLTGRGIVASVDNFGVLGQRPTHPELLDWLADDFRNHGWSVKRTIKTVLLSSTYRMDSKPAAGSEQDAMNIAANDPDNLLLHRMRVKRLEGEVIRDSMLSLSGRYDDTMFGVSVPVHLTAFMEGRGRPKQSGPLDGDGRRSIYTAIRRNFLPDMMLAFDMPIPFNAMGRRSVSNVPAQALILMNNPLVIQQAELWAKRLLGMEGLDDGSRVQMLYQMAFARDPQTLELEQALVFIGEQSQTLADTSKPDPRAAAWADLCHVIMNVKEFIFIR